MAYLSLKQGIKFPWQKPRRLLYALWILVPIFGWFAMAGFGVKIIKNLVKGKNKEVPEFGKFWENFLNGCIIILKIIPLLIVITICDWLLIKIPLLGTLLYIMFVLLTLLLVPYLFVNLVVTWQVEESFNVKKAWSVITKNLKDYLIAYLKSFAYGIIYILLSIILIGIPCNMYGKYYFFSDFYRKAK